ncbi:MAG: cytochrome c [Gammaproteobacteria bacterium]
MPLFVALITTHHINGRHAAVVAALFLMVFSVVPMSFAAISDQQQLELGKRIYREGVLPSGGTLRASVQGGVPLTGAQAACVRCHQRSALGSSEGGKVVPPLRGTMAPEPAVVPEKASSPPRNGSGRHTYSAVTLSRALREGVDPAGRKFDTLMPAYQLSRDEVAALHAYLSAFPAGPDPGVDGRNIHFATVIAGAVNTVSRQALLNVLQTYFKEKNAETRSETVRRAYAARAQEKMYRAHRTWVLHVWELKGSPASWPAQLENYYRQQPVFALLSGVSAGDWQPVHDFCERREVPCLFPNTDAPPVADDALYSIYFSKGVALEAQVLARHLRAPAHGALTGTMMQVYRDDGAGRRAAQALRAALSGADAAKLVDRVITGGSPTEQFWGTLLERDRPSLLMLWLHTADLTGLRAVLKPVANGVFLSSSLIGDDLRQLPQALPGQGYLLHPFVLAQDRDRTLARTRIWLRSRKIVAADERLLANSYFAVTVAGEALMHMRDNFSRDYFIERVEHSVDNALNSSVYPHVSLGPGQRYASKGAYIIRLQEGQPTSAPVSGWIIP